MSPLFLRNLFYLINLDNKDFAAKASDINFTLRRQIALSGNPFTANRGMIRGVIFPHTKELPAESDDGIVPGIGLAGTLRWLLLA